MIESGENEVSVLQVIWSLLDAMFMSIDGVVFYVVALALPIILMYLIGPLFNSVDKSRATHFAAQHSLSWGKKNRRKAPWYLNPPKRGKGVLRARWYYHASYSLSLGLFSAGLLTSLLVVPDYRRPANGDGFVVVTPQDVGSKSFTTSAFQLIAPESLGEHQRTMELVTSVVGWLSIGMLLLHSIAPYAKTNSTSFKGRFMSTWLAWITVLIPIAFHLFFRLQLDLGR